jgi:glucose/arabinose dehydrogenase
VHVCEAATGKHVFAHQGHTGQVHAVVWSPDGRYLASASDGLVYAYYSTAQDNRVVRFRLGEQPQPILTGIPVSSIHNGGRIAFGPDGMLYIGTGDASKRDEAQNLQSLSGKILRIMPDGRVPADNLFPNNPVYSYGHRNVQGLAWDARGQLYATEFGQNSFDEVNRIVPGGNYGWPEIEGDGGDKRSIRPVTTFRVAEASPSGAVILRGGAILQWEGNLFVAGLRGERLWRLVLDSDGSVTQREPLLQGEYGRLRHVAQAPDGSLWVLTSNRDGRGSPTSDDDRILRIGSADR